MKGEGGNKLTIYIIFFRIFKNNKPNLKAFGRFRVFSALINFIYQGLRADPQPILSIFIKK